MRTMQLLVATFWGWLIYDNLPDGFTLLGMLVILSSGSYVLNDGRRAAPGRVPTRCLNAREASAASG